MSAPAGSWHAARIAGALLLAVSPVLALDGAPGPQPKSASGLLIGILVCRFEAVPTTQGHYPL